MAEGKVTQPIHGLAVVQPGVDIWSWGAEDWQVLHRIHLMRCWLTIEG